MKDLKHLLYFENLLQEAHNDLIAQAQNEGKICVVPMPAKTRQSRC